MEWTMCEKTFKTLLLQQANIENGHQVLDLGCGTGTLTLMMKKLHPGAEVHALDADPKALKIAGDKMKSEGAVVHFIQGYSYKLPYPENTFDRIVSSLMFHHLTREDKSKTLQEMHRVLRPGGEIHIADWGKAQNVLMRIAFYSIQLLDGFSTTSDHVKGVFPELIHKAGFSSAKEQKRIATIYGTLSLYSAKKDILTSLSLTPVR
ncbi:class I SAM-dependent methyltransferase [Cohnella algarum]|nr:class I SAM-dependent methyltransferase [Cohnella algarum]